MTIHDSRSEWEEDPAGERFMETVVEFICNDFKISGYTIVNSKLFNAFFGAKGKVPKL